jgi:hypothetical protein
MKIESDKNAGEWPWGEDIPNEVFSKIFSGEKGVADNGWTLFHIYGDIEFIKLVYLDTPELLNRKLKKGIRDLKISFGEKIYT